MTSWIPVVRDIVIIVAGLGVIVVAGALLIQVRPMVQGIARLLGSLEEVLALLREQSKQVGDLLLSARALTDALNETHRHHVVPTMAHLEHTSEELDRTVHRVAEVVDEGVELGRETIGQVRRYRDRVFRPVLEVASIWYGVRTVLRVVPVRRLLRLPGRRRRGSESNR